MRLTVASRTAEVRAEELQAIFDPIQVVQENLIDVGPSVSQRIIETPGRPARSQTGSRRGQLHRLAAGRGAAMSDRPQRAGGRRRDGTARIAAHDPEAALRDRDGGQRRGRAQDARHVPARPHLHGHQDAADGRHRAPAPHQARRPEHRGRDDHGLRLAGDGQERADPRRLRVPDQALQPAGPGGDGAPGPRPPAVRDRHPQPGRRARRRDALAGRQDPRPARTRPERAGRAVAAGHPALDPARDLA